MAKAKRPVVTYVPISIALRRVFMDLDRRFQGLGGAPGEAARQAEELLCLVSGVHAIDVEQGTINRPDMEKLVLAAAALSKMEIACVEIEWPR